MNNSTNGTKKGKHRPFHVGKAVAKINNDLESQKLSLSENVFFKEVGNYTICQVVGLVTDKRRKQNRFHGYGVSKRNPMDPKDPSVGRRLALSRAVSNMVEESKVQHHG